MDLLQQFKRYLFSQKNQPSKATVKNYTADINQFIRWFEAEFSKEFTVTDVTPQIIALYKQAKIKVDEKIPNTAISSRSLERHLSSLRKFFHFLKINGIISSDPLQPKTYNLSPKPDPWRLKDFKNYLYIYNSSALTIKNYIIDINQFLRWAEEVSGIKNAWEVGEKNLFAKIDGLMIEEYKNRLLEGGLSAVSINRKLSSIRKYLGWAKSEGLIKVSGVRFQVLGIGQTEKIFDSPPTQPITYPLRQSVSETSNLKPITYSSFPPLRLVQKVTKSINFLFDQLAIVPIDETIKTARYLTWRLKGKPIFHEVPKKGQSRLNTKYQILNTSNIKKEFYAPLSISTRFLPLRQKLWYYLRHNRPNWYRKYHSYPVTHYFHLAILVIFMTAIGFGMYNAFIQTPKTQGPALAAPVAPPRILSFQGRLTDASDNPITTANTNLRLTIYNNLTASGAALLWQEIVSVSPDSDGIFSVILGNNTALTQSLFAENASLYLGVTVNTDPELTPRQQLATVAYATNAEVLQGLPPITDTGVTTNTNAVLALNSSGQVSIAGTAATTFLSTGGQITITGKTVALTTASGTATNVQIAPDGLGKIDLQKPIQNSTNNNNISTAVGGVEIDDLVAILATSSGQSALTINQTSTGPLISASASGVAKFNVDASGNVGIGATTPGALLQVGTNNTTSSTGTKTAEFQYGIIVGDNNAGGLNFRNAAGTGTIYGLGLDASDNLYLGFNSSNLYLRVGSANELALNATSFSPATSDGNALGTTALMWADLFLASGGVINFNNGDVTMTHSTNTLAFAGASSGYSFDADTTITGDLAVNGATSADITSTTTTGTLFNTTVTTLSIGGAATTLNIGPTGSGASSLVMSGGSADTGCTLDGSNGNLTCAGNISGSSSGTAGFWTRTSTTLSPATSNDIVSISSNTTSAAVLALTSTGATSNAFTLTGNSITTGTGLNISTTGLTTGNALTITTNSTATGLALNVASGAVSFNEAGVGTAAKLAESMIFHLPFNKTLTSTKGDKPTWSGRSDTGAQGTYTNENGKLVTISSAGDPRFGRVIDVVNDKAPQGYYFSHENAFGATNNNKQVNSSFETGTPPGSWTADTGLTVTQDSTYSIHKTYSAKLVADTSDRRYYQSSSCNGYDVVGVYARNSAGTAITTSDVDLLIRNDASVTGIGAVFTKVTQDGWYRVAARGVLAGTCNYGVVVKANKTVWIDAFQTQSGSHNALGNYVETTAATSTMGTDGNLTYSTTNNFNKDHGSISFWYQNWDLNARFNVFADSGSNWAVRFLNGTTPEFTPDGGTTTVSGSALTSYSGVWHYIVATWDSSNIKIYQNGVQTGTASAPASYTAIGANMGVCTYMSWGPNGDGCFGNMTDFAIFNRALTATEVSQIYNSRAPLQDNFSNVAVLAQEATAGNILSQPGGLFLASTATTVTANQLAANSLTTGTALNVSATSLTTGTALQVDVDALTTGQAFAFEQDNRDMLALTDRDLTVGGHTDLTTQTTITDTFVYDTGKDVDGGVWVDDGKTRGSSWYNETIDATGPGCTVDTNDRCGQRAFPKKALLVVTTTKLYIYDAKDNTLWMDFRKGATTTEQMIGPTTNSTGSVVFALNGKIYYGNNGTVGGLYIIDFKNDTAQKFNATDDYVGNLPISSRNSTITWNPGPSAPLGNTIVRDVHSAYLNGKTYTAVATDGATSVIQENDNRVLRYSGDSTNYEHKALWIDKKGTLWMLDQTSQKLNRATTIHQDTANKGVYYGDTWKTATVWTGPPIWPSAVTFNNSAPDALWVTDGTSTVDNGQSPTVYIAHSAGLTVINTNERDETNSSVKYYTNTYITEEMAGDIRTMIPMIETASLTTSGTDIADRSYQANRLMTNAITTNSIVSVSAVRGTGLTLDGTDDYLCADTDNDVSNVCDDNVDFDFAAADNFSIGIWFKHNTIATTEDYLVTKGDGTVQGYKVWMDASGDMCFGVDDDATWTPDDQACTSAVDYDDNNWHHLAAVKQGTAFLRLHVDGVLVASDTSIAATGTLANAGALNVGADSTPAAGTVWAGSVDELMITGEALTANQVRQIYTVGLSALQNHSSTDDRDDDGTASDADTLQNIFGSTNSVSSVAVDTTRSYIYLGTRESSDGANDGGVSVIGAHSDSRAKTYSIDGAQADDDGTTFANDDIISLSISGAIQPDTSCTTSNCNTRQLGGTLLIGTDGDFWAETKDTSFQDFMANSFNPFGETLHQTNLSVSGVFEAKSASNLALNNQSPTPGTVIRLNPNMNSPQNNTEVSQVSYAPNLSSTASNAIEVTQGNRTLLALSDRDLTLGGRARLVNTVVVAGSSTAQAVQVFVYDTGKDSDGGKWTDDDRAKSASWYNDIGNTSYPHGFPKVAIIMAYRTPGGTSGSAVLIYDAKDFSLWKSLGTWSATASAINSVYALNGKIYMTGQMGGSYGVTVHDFIRDKSYQWGGNGCGAGNLCEWSPSGGIGFISSNNAEAPTVVNSVANLSSSTDTRNSVHVQIVNGKTYFAAATDSEVLLVNETDQTARLYCDNASDDYNNAWLDKEGNLWALNETTGTLELWKKVTSDSAGECAGTPDKTWDELSTPALTNTAPTIQVSSVNDLYVTDGTSAVDGKSQTVYVGTNQGVTVVNTNRADESNSSVKYITKDWISEEMPGDVRGMWHLTDNAASATVDDVTLKANDLTLYADSDGTPSTTANTTTVTATGVRGKGFNLNGSTNFLYRTDDDFNFTSGDFTISMWVNPDTFTTNSRTLLTYGDNSTTGYDLELTRTADGTATVTFKTYQAGPASQSTTATASNIRSTYYQGTNNLEWYHIAVVRSGTSARIYVNGHDDTSTAGTHTNPATATGSNLVIGAKQNGASQWYDGQLDEVMITAEALSPSQIQQIALNGLHALKNHEGVDTDGDGSADSDTIQQLYGSTNTVRAVTVDPSNSYLYVATNDGADAGGISVIGLNSDTREQVYSNDNATTNKETDSENNVFTDDDWISISMSGNVRPDVQRPGAKLGGTIAMSNATEFYMQSFDLSLQDFLANNYNPFGETLNQTNLKVASAFSVGTYWQAANTTSGVRSSEKIESQVFRIDNMGNLAWNANDTTGTAGSWTFATTTGTGLDSNFNSVTTGTGLNIDADALTTGTALSLSSTSTAGGGSGTSKLLNLSRSGANASASHTAYGLYSSVTNTGATSTNVAAYLSATGATNNYALVIANGNMGIGTSTPSSTYGLAVNGSIAASAFYDYDNAVYFLDPAATTTSLNIAGGASIGGYATASASLSVGTYNAPAGPGNAVFSGNVGIGTATPNQQLEITGNFRLPATTATTGIIYQGTSTYIHTTGGTSNFFAGVGAGNTTLTGTFNTAVGASAGASITSGGTNTLFGRYAGNAITTGGSNNAFGYNAGLGVTTGGSNVFIGNSAGQSLTTGSQNTFVGSNVVGSGIVTGTDNTIIGYAGGSLLTTGNYNTYVGGEAGRTATTASNRTMMGYFAGYSSTGADNTFIGYTAGRTSSTGTNNTFVGSVAGNANTTGSNNILIGYAAGNAITTGSNNLIIGYDIDAPSATASNQMSIGNLIFATGVDGTGTTVSTGLVSIGTAVPTFDLTVSGNIGPTNGPTIAATTQTATTIDSAGNVQYGNSVVIGPDGFPIISYNIQGSAIRVTKCGNAACSSGNTSTSVATGNVYVYQSTSNMAMGADGLPALLYLEDPTALHLVKCGNLTCSSGNTDTVIKSGIGSIYMFAIAIGTDGFPVVAYGNNSARAFIKCSNAACTSSSETTALSIGDFSSIAIGTDGLPIVVSSYANDLVVIHCGNASCSSGNTTTTNVDNSANGVDTPSIAIGSDGLPVITYYDSTNGDLEFVKCGNAACSSGNLNVTVESTNTVGQYASVTTGTDGLPFIAYYDGTALNQDLRVAKCSNPACTASTITSIDTTNNVGSFTYAVIGADGLPFISYNDTTNANMMVIKCATVSCSATSGTALSGGGSLGNWMPNPRSFGSAFESLNTYQIANPSTFRRLSFLTAGTERMSIDVNGEVGIGTTSPGGLLDVSRALTGAAPGLTGPYLSLSASTFTDQSTAASGTATNMVFNSIAGPTLAASNTSVTTTNAATLYIAAAPTAGTNQTITNPYALWVDAGEARFDGIITADATSTTGIRFGTGSPYPNIALNSSNLEIGTRSNNAIKFYINGSYAVDLDASSLSPNADGGRALGTTTLGWNGLHLNTGTAINWENGDVTLTHATDALTLAGGSLTITGSEGSNQLVVTAGDAAISDGSLSITDDDNAVSLQLTNNTITTGNLANITSTSLTTGSAFKVEVDGLTTGNALEVEQDNRDMLALTDRDLTVGGHTDLTTLSGIKETRIYDTSKDLDGGKWTDGEQARAASWYNETLSDADRGASRPFPKKAILVSAGSVFNIYDAKDNTLWMSFTQGSNNMAGPISGTVYSAFGLNGKIYLAVDKGWVAIDFIKDTARFYWGYGAVYYNSTIANRNAGSNYGSPYTGTTTTGTTGTTIVYTEDTNEANIIAAKKLYIGGSGSRFAYRTIDTIDTGTNTITTSGANGWDTTLTTGLTFYANAEADGNLSSYNADGMRKIHAETYQGKTYVAVAHYTLWFNIFNETDNVFLDNTNVTVVNQDFSDLQLVNGNLYMAWLGYPLVSVEYDYPTDTTLDADYANADVFYRWQAGSYIPMPPNGSLNSLFITQGTSTVDGKSNTIYGVTDSAGGFVLQEKRGDETNGSIKYFTKTYITEELIGDIQVMTPMTETASLTTSGTDIADVTIGANNLMTNAITTNNITSATGAVRGTGLTLDGTDDYLCMDTAGADTTCDDDANLDFAGNFSIGVWFKHNTISTTEDYLVTKGDGTVQGYKVWMDASGDMCFGVDDDATWTPDDSACTSGENYDDNLWHQVVAVKTGTSKIELFIDGILLASDASLLATGTLANAGALNVGADSTPAAGTVWAGSIDEFFVTAEAMTSSQVKQMFQTGYLASQNHTANRVDSVTADNYQKLQGTSDTVKAVAVDDGGRYIYFGTGDGVSVIGLKSDTLVNQFLDGNKTDDDGTAFNNDSIVSISVTGAPAVGYNSDTTPYSRQSTLVIGTAAEHWIQTEDVSFQNFIANSFNPFGESLYQSNLTVGQSFFVGNNLLPATITSGVTWGDYIPNPTFQVNPNGDVIIGANNNKAYGTSSTDKSNRLGFSALESGILKTAYLWFDTASTDSLNSTVAITTTAQTYDIAEDFPTRDASIEAGDVVAVDKEASSSAYLTKSSKPYQNDLIGIVSTNPGFRLSQEDGVLENPVKVALAGRVPVKVSTENGPIEKGDYLTSSSVAGVAMRATRAGVVIGKALEPFGSSNELLVHGSGTDSTTNNEPTTHNQILQGKILAFVNLSWHDPDIYLTESGDIKILSNEVIKESSSAPSITQLPNYQLLNKTGEVIRRVGAFAEIAVANLRAGFINVQELVANRLVANKLISPIAEIDMVRTNLISPLASNNLIIKLASQGETLEATGTGKLEIQNASGSAVAVIDSKGNASFSGQLSSNELSSNNATIAGTLRADKIIANEIEGLEARFSTVSAQYITNVTNVYQATESASSVQGIASSSVNLAQNNYTLDASSLDAIDISQFSASFATFRAGLMAFGPSSFSDISVSSQLSVSGNLILADSSINVLGVDLQIQPLRQGGISFLSGLVRIDEDGNLSVSGNAQFAKDVKVGGKLAANIIAPIPTSDLSIQNASGSAVVSINQKGDIHASGSATLAKLNFNLTSPALAISEIEALASGSAGVATVSAQRSEITIRNSLITDKSLIYITPVSDTNNQVLYLIRQQPLTSFTVGLSRPTTQDIPFNWLIIN